MENPPFFTRYLVHSVLYVDFSDIFFLNSIDDLLLLEGRGLDFPRKEGKGLGWKFEKISSLPLKKKGNIVEEEEGENFAQQLRTLPSSESKLLAPLESPPPAKPLKPWSSRAKKPFE